MRHLLALAVAGLLALAPPAAMATETPLGRLPKSYAGTLPTASGPGADWRLDLLGDGSFQLRQAYRDRGDDGVIDSIGRFELASDASSLVLFADRPIGFAIESPARLRLLDTELEPIASDLPYTLEASDLPLLEPELRLLGLYRYLADAALFDECRTGRRLPISFTADNIALERAYLALVEAGGIAPGEPVLAELDGRLAMLPPMEGKGLVPQLVPLAFVELWPGESC